jgi:hypothetical protein
MVFIIYKLISNIFILNRIREKGKAKVEISILPYGRKSKMYREKGDNPATGIDDRETSSSPPGLVLCPRRVRLIYYAFLSKIQDRPYLLLFD